MRVFCLLIRRRSPGSLMVLVLATALLGCIPQAASAEESSASSEAEFYSVCPAQPGHYECMVQAQPLALTLSGITPQVSPNLEGGGEKGGLDPQNLREAYKLPETGGSGQTVAIVDAFNDPKAEANLNVYREKYGLGSCTRSNGCFKKVNQKGESSENEEASIYPANEYEWSVEISLDLDMVSAICEECHIVLVEAINNKKNSEGVYNLDIAENEAAALKGTTEISNSWGGSERSEETSEDTYFNHPGIPITFSAGDSGYGVEYPAASHHGIAVGGTTLKKAENSRGWSETVWSGTGSGCSAYDEKPLWQTGSPWQADTSCTHRTNNDVAADASGASPVSVYDSYEYPGWEIVWGTSAASPIVSGIEAHANSYTKSLGADAFYQKPSMLFHVSEGSNGTCGTESESTWFLCHATKEGYNAPTGWGTPDGIPTLGVWSDKTTENPSSEFNQLTGVSCSSSTACTGVGSYGSSSPDTLAERWNGTSWSKQTIPTPAKSESILRGVSCTSSTACKAVGLSENTTTGVVETLAETWNGTEWTIQKTPNPSGAQGSRLFGISCTSSSACLAVGTYETSSYEERTLGESWNCTEWTIYEPNNPA